MSQISGTIYTVVVDVVDTNTAAVPVSVNISYFRVDSAVSDSTVVKKVGYNESTLNSGEVQPGDRYEVKIVHVGAIDKTKTLAQLADAAGTAIDTYGVLWANYD